MKGSKKAAKMLVDAVAEARDEALIEIGREATARQAARQGKGRHRSAGKMALAAVAAGAALATGAAVLRRRQAKRRAEDPVTLSGAPEKQG
jgi:hypothetical protein